jgi:hypothetical protein
MRKDFGSSVNVPGHNYVCELQRTKDGIVSRARRALHEQPWFSATRHALDPIFRPGFVTPYRWRGLHLRLELLAHLEPGVGIGGSAEGGRYSVSQHAPHRVDAVLVASAYVLCVCLPGDIL